MNTRSCLGTLSLAGLLAFLAGCPNPQTYGTPRTIATAVGAESATYTVVVDRVGTIRYRGGIDSDRTHLTPDATPYLADALEDLLAGRAPRVPESRALGCALAR